MTYSLLRESRLTLRVLLTIPYVLLVLLAALVIGSLSYIAGRNAVDTLADYVLNETVNRIAQAVDKHISGSEAVLETAFPSEVPAPSSIKNDLNTMRTRFWLATTVHRDPNNYAYYGDRDGNFFGLWRYSESEAELRLRTDAVSPRIIYRFSGIHGELRNAVQEQRIYDPRERPWFKAGQSVTTQTWTAIYIDFKTLQLVGTRARRVNNAAGEFQGVVATDLSLQHLNDFLKSLKLSRNGFAFVVENDGNLLATSRGPHLRKGVGDDNTRLNAAVSEDPWIKSTYTSVKGLISKSGDAGGPRTSKFTGPNGETVQVGYARLRDKAGLDWIVAVGVPRSDFMQEVTDNAWRTTWMALIACSLIALIGYWVLNRIARDLRQLAMAARDVGEGKLDSTLPTDRKDEIGDLAKSFRDMQQRLFTDRLTGIANREAVMRRIEDRIIRHRRQGDSRPFAILFVDLDRFKQVNDRFGHDVGDQVLIEIGRRLESNLRSVDLASRYGGDEFVVLLDNVSNNRDAEVARAKLESALAQPLQSLMDIAPDLSTFASSASIGLALCPEDGNDLETLLKRADADMYERKKSRESAPR